MGSHLNEAILAVALAALTCDGYSATVEPVELTFKELRIGVSTQADFKAVFPFVAGTPYQSSQTVPGLGRQTFMIGEDKGADCHSAGDSVGYRDMKWDSAACSWRVPTGASPSAKYGGSVTLSSVDASFEDGKLVQLRIVLKDPGKYGEILLALTEKFGTPQLESTVVQNKMGANFDQQIATWSSLGKTLTYSKRGHDLTVSGMTLWDDAFHARELEKFKQRIKDTAKSGL